MTTRNQRRARRLAFSLMEVLVVVAIMVILALSGGVIYMRYLDDAKKDRARIDVETLSKAVEGYSLKHGYPATLDILCQPTPDGGRPYLDPSALVDPWGQPYQYAYPGTHNAMNGKPDVWSLGPRIGDQNGIIGNWSIMAGAGGH
jgi:general secretion pathway protein G